jgi:hypothetical protein
VATEDRSINPDQERMMAKRANAKTVEVDCCYHFWDKRNNWHHYCSFLHMCGCAAWAFASSCSLIQRLRIHLPTTNNLGALADRLETNKIPPSASMEDKSGLRSSRRSQGGTVGEEAPCTWSSSLTPSIGR